MVEISIYHDQPSWDKTRRAKKTESKNTRHFGLVLEKFGTSRQKQY